MEVSLSLLNHQHCFVEDLEHRYVAFVGGYGSGKTHAFCAKALYLAWLNAGHTGLMLEPTHAMAADVLIPQFKELLHANEIQYAYKATPYPTFTVYFKEGKSTILVRSAENYGKLVGLNLAWFGVDEADTIKKDIASRMWKVLQSRLRARAPVLQGYTTSTPEGFGFIYEFFVKNAADDRKIYRAKSTDNPYLDPGFIPSLLRSYPEQLIRAYINGEFVNLQSGQVYYTFDRHLNHSDFNYKSFDIPGKPSDLHIGMDFNVGKCCGIVHIINPDTGFPIAVDEITNVFNTEEMINKIRDRYPRRTIYIYPDASGANRKTNAAVTDIQLLRQAGFVVTVDASNPAVKDRINTVNALFCNSSGERRYHVNTKLCPLYTEALETQGYNASGEPDKSHNQDHPVDAAGYFICKRYPLRVHSSGRTIKLLGI